MTPHQEALSLKAQWERVRGMGAAAMRACGCGMQTPHVSAADFELDLLEYLAHRYKNESGLHALLNGAEQSRPNLSAILSMLPSSGIDPILQRRFTDDVARSIVSFGSCSINQRNFYCEAP